MCLVLVQEESTTPLQIEVMTNKWTMGFILFGVILVIELDELNGLRKDFKMGSCTNYVNKFNIEGYSEDRIIFAFISSIKVCDISLCS
jgi:hypothetical protein